VRSGYTGNLEEEKGRTNAVNSCGLDMSGRGAPAPLTEALAPAGGCLLAAVGVVSARLVVPVRAGWGVEVGMGGKVVREGVLSGRAGKGIQDIQVPSMEVRQSQLELELGIVDCLSKSTTARTCWADGREPGTVCVRCGPWRGGRAPPVW
jgi:hypothetical protein